MIKMYFPIADVHIKSFFGTMFFIPFKKKYGVHNMSSERILTNQVAR